jgi:hypothetical protein
LVVFTGCADPEGGILEISDTPLASSPTDAADDGFTSASEGSAAVTDLVV